MPAVSKFVQISMKHDLLCIAWQFSVESLPKGDRNLIRRRQEILKQIWKLTFELGVLTGADPSVWQLSILLLLTTGKIQVLRILNEQEVCPRPAPPEPFYFCSSGSDLSPNVQGSHFPAPEISESFCCLLRFPPKHGRSFWACLTKLWHFQYVNATFNLGLKPCLGNVRRASASQ